MIPQFILEILVFILVIVILKKVFKDKAKYWVGYFAIGLNILVIILYLQGGFNGYFKWIDACSKAFLHGVVAMIIYTLFIIDKKQNKDGTDKP
jgi:hypothetical protein